MAELALTCVLSRDSSDRSYCRKPEGEALGDAHPGQASGVGSLGIGVDDAWYDMF